jgi:hypothetical protein
MPAYVSAPAKDIIVKLLNRNPQKRLGTANGAEEIKAHPFFKGIDWRKVINREYKMPEPYLKKRFENFIKLNPTIKSHTNAEAYEN